jgi:hypothetical protein
MRTASGCDAGSAETAEGVEESRRWLARTRPPASTAKRRIRGRVNDDAIAAANAAAAGQAVPVGGGRGIGFGLSRVGLRG